MIAPFDGMVVFSSAAVLAWLCWGFLQSITAPLNKFYSMRSAIPLLIAFLLLVNTVHLTMWAVISAQIEVTDNQEATK